MSQSTLPEQIPPSPTDADLTSASDQATPYELDYQPTPIMAPVALFLGIAAFSGLMGLPGLVLALVGIFVSLGAVLQIRAGKDRYSGMNLAVIGGGLSTFFLGLGSYLMYSDYKAELPPGYTRVNFPSEIAEKQFVFEGNQRKIHPEVKPFVDQPIFVKGWMWQTASAGSSFILLKDNGKCCFGGNPAAYDMMLVQMQNGDEFPYQSGLISVAGVLRANPDAQTGQAVYIMEAAQVARAKTKF